MRTTVLLLLGALVGALLMVGFVAITGTGAPGFYAAGVVAVALNMAMLAWDDRRQARRLR